MKRVFAIVAVMTCTAAGFAYAAYEAAEACRTLGSCDGCWSATPYAHGKTNYYGWPGCGAPAKTAYGYGRQYPFTYAGYNHPHDNESHYYGGGQEFALGAGW